MSKRPASIPVVILVRVSTLKQETSRQISELQAYAKQKGYNVVEVCRETVSGRADESERDGLHRVEELAINGKIRKVLVHEVSRLARRNSIVHKFVEMLEDHSVSLYWHAQGVETLLANGKRNPATSMMLALLAEIARNEVETMRERIKSGLAEARRQGKRLGPSARHLPRLAGLPRQTQRCDSSASAKQSVRNTAKITGKGASTVQRVKAVLPPLSQAWHRSTDL